MNTKKPRNKEQISFQNIGWSLGNACPFRCKQCYSRSVRKQGVNLNKEIIDRIINQLANLQVKTINLGGNEPIYTNGLNTKISLLPYIIKEIIKKGIMVGVTTAGPTLIELEQHYPECLKKINDVDISLDSPQEEEHDKNRGQKGIFQLAMKALKICQRYYIPRTFIMCGMRWNFTPDRIRELIDLGRKNDANVRINPIKPVENFQKDLVLTPQQFYEGLAILLNECDPIDLSDPAWASAAKVNSVSGCPCGASSFRINSITPEGKISVSPCVYLHDFKVGDLTCMDISEIIKSKPFKDFEQRKNHPELIKGCQGCPLIKICGGGCASRAYLHKKYVSGEKTATLLIKDPYCIKNVDFDKLNIPDVSFPKKTDHQLVHQGYLCTGIFTPRK